MHQSMKLGISYTKVPSLSWQKIGSLQDILILTYLLFNWYCNVYTRELKGSPLEGMRAWLFIFDTLNTIKKISLSVEGIAYANET